jgi:hypothetical protein
MICLPVNWASTRVVCLQVTTWDAAPRRVGYSELRLRLTDERVARPCSRMRARVRAQGQRTPAQGQGLTFGWSSRTSRRACHPLDAAPRRALAKRSKSGTLTARRRRGMPLAFHRTPGGRERGERMDL